MTSPLTHGFHNETKGQWTTLIPEFHELNPLSFVLMKPCDGFCFRHFFLFVWYTLWDLPFSALALAGKSPCQGWDFSFYHVLIKPVSLPCLGAWHAGSIRFSSTPQWISTFVPVTVWAPARNHLKQECMIWLVVSTIFYFSIMYGMSSFPLTFIFFKMVIAPPTSETCWNVPIPLLGWVWTSHIIAGVIMAQSYSCLPDILKGKDKKNGTTVSSKHIQHIHTLYIFMYCFLSTQL